MDSSDLMLVAVLVEILVTITCLILFVKLCGRVRDISEMLLLAFDLERVRVSDPHSSGYKWGMRKKKLA